MYSNEAVSAAQAQSSRGFPKIDQLCVDLRKELMGRHQQLLLDRGLFRTDADTVSLPEGKGAGGGGGEGEGEGAVLPREVDARVLEGALLMDDAGNIVHSLAGVSAAGGRHAWKQCMLNVTADLDIWYAVVLMQVLACTQCSVPECSVLPTSISGTL